MKLLLVCKSLSPKLIYGLGFYNLLNLVPFSCLFKVVQSGGKNIELAVMRRDQPLKVTNFYSVIVSTLICQGMFPYYFPPECHINLKAAYGRIRTRAVSV